MPRAWKTPRPGRRRLRRLGIPQEVANQPRYRLDRAIRTVSLAQLNAAEDKIGASEIAHETDLHFLETLESFAAQLEEGMEIQLDEDPAGEDRATHVEGAALPDEDGLGDEELQADDLLADIEEAAEEPLELDDMLEDVEDAPIAEPDEPTTVSPIPKEAIVDGAPPPPPAVATPMALGDEPPTIVEPSQLAPTDLTPTFDEADDGTLSDDDDSLDLDTSEILEAVEQTDAELGEIEGDPVEGAIEAGAARRETDEKIFESDDMPVLPPSLQSWDGNSLEEYLDRSGERALASWDGDSLDEYMGRGGDLGDSPASWDGISYEEYLEGDRAGTDDADDGDEGPSEGGQVWLRETEGGPLTPDPAADPLGLGEDFGGERALPQGDERYDPGALVEEEPSDEVEIEHEISDEELDLELSALSLELGVDDMDLDGAQEDTSEVVPGGPEPGATPPAGQASLIGAASPSEENSELELEAPEVEVHSQSELIVQVGSGLDDSLSAAPISLVLDAEEGDPGEPSLGPMDDLSGRLAIPRSASLAAPSDTAGSSEGAGGGDTDAPDEEK